MDSFANLFISFIAKFGDGLKYIFYQILLQVDFIPQKLVTHFMAKAGVGFDGKNSWDIRVHDRRFYARVCAYGTTGFGESYLDGWWDCDELDVLYTNVMRSGIFQIYGKPWMRVLHDLEFNVFNRQSRSRVKDVAKVHYNFGNDVFESFLDPSMNYSCGYWKTATTLTQAQIDKMELIGQKLKLAPGMRVLDIGIGYGGIDKYLCEKFGVSVVGYTIAEEHAKEARRRCKGLDVKVIVDDYRNISGKFDRIFSLEMLEHVGPPNYKDYFGIAHKCLVPDGLFLVQVNVTQDRDCQTTDGYFNKVFPNIRAPRLEEVVTATNRLFVMEDMHNMGAHYDQTLKAWGANFEANWHKLADKYGNKIYRLFKLYLEGGAGQMRARSAHVTHFVFSKQGLIGGYDSVR